MPREARLFDSSEGSAVRGYLKFQGNISPSWIQHARTVAALGSLKRLRTRRPRARVAIRSSRKELRAVLDRWEIAYRKENFYRGIRILLELQRGGSSKL